MSGGRKREVLWFAGFGLGLAGLIAVIAISSSTGRQIGQTAQAEIPIRPEVQPYHTGNPANDMLLDGGDTLAAEGLGKVAGCTAARTFYAGLAPDKTAIWDIECSDGKSYSISISPNATGSTRVLDCDLLNALTGPSSCFKKLE
jgi:hypothetical protein